MNIELTTNNLSKICRVCLSEGEINLHNKPAISELHDNSRDTDQEDESTDALHKIFEIFNCDEIETNLPLFSEMPLICTECLNELLQCQRFHQKLQLGNSQICQLYTEALKIERDICFELIEDDLSEAVGPIAENISCNVTTKSIESAEDTPELFGDTSICENDGDPERRDHEISTAESPTNRSSLEAQTLQKKRTLSNQKVDLTNSGHKPAHSNNIQRQHESELPVNSAKRQRRIQHSGNHEPNSPVQQNASLVITRFIPDTPNTVPSEGVITSHSILRSSGDGGEVRTMKYSAVEVRAHKFNSLIDEDEMYSTVASSPQNTTREVSGDLPVYQCQYCPQAFALAQYLITHACKSHVCKFCTQAFVKTADLYKHIRKAHQHHRCAICSKELSSHSNLRSHIRRLHGINLPAQVALLGYKPADIGQNIHLASATADEESCFTTEEESSLLSPEEFNQDGVIAVYNSCTASKPRNIDTKRTGKSVAKEKEKYRHYTLKSYKEVDDNNEFVVCLEYENDLS